MSGGDYTTSVNAFQGFAGRTKSLLQFNGEKELTAW
jgi:hypothetical protein